MEVGDLCDNPATPEILVLSGERGRPRQRARRSETMDVDEAGSNNARTWMVLLIVLSI